MTYKEQIEGLVKSFNDEMTDPFIGKERGEDKNGKFEFIEENHLHGKVNPDDPDRITRRLMLVFMYDLDIHDPKQIIVMEFDNPKDDIDYKIFWQQLIRYTLFAIKAEGLVSSMGNPLDVIPIANFIKGDYGRK